MADRSNLEFAAAVLTGCLALLGLPQFVAFVRTPGRRKL